MIDFIPGFLAPFVVYALILTLHLALPARRVSGYVRDSATGNPLSYRLNGPVVLLVMVGLWTILGRTGLLPTDWLYAHRWPALAGACVIGLAYSFAEFRAGQPVKHSFGADFFFGRRENPRYFGGRVDAKMFLYLAGATMLALNILSFAAAHLKTYGTLSSPGIILYTCLFGWFICEYLIFEQVHLYTYDLFAERVGFKLGWGCLVFYPFFYAVGIWAASALPNPGAPRLLLIAAALVFFSGWMLSRGANMQKFYFKRQSQRAFLGFLKPTALSDGQRSLLCGGFWRIARHVNYLGEILMATGLTLALGYPTLLVAWLYPLYYVALLLPRERDDERRCSAKYGELWQQYVTLVPRRIIPWLY